MQALQKRAYFIQTSPGLIFEQIVGGIVQLDSFGMWPASLKLFEKSGVEAPVAHAPDQFDGGLRELFQSRFDIAERFVTGMPGVHRNVLHESMDRNPIGPVVVRCEISLFCGSCPD